MLGGGILSHVVGECCRCSTRRTTTALSGLSTTTKSTHIGVRPSKRFKGVIFTLEEAIEKAKNSADTPNTYYEINFMLNIDRKMNGQNLEGMFKLPHGIGKRVPNLIALTTDEDLQISALQCGAMHAGNLVKSLKDVITRKVSYGRRCIASRVVATPEMEELWTKKVSARTILKREKLLPSPHQGTMVEPSKFVETVKNLVDGQWIPFSTGKHGNVFSKIGFLEMHTPEQVAENFHAALNLILAKEPDHFGDSRASKKINAGKFVIGVYVGASRKHKYQVDTSSMIQPHW